MTVPRDAAISVSHRGHAVRFCSASCADAFLKHPEVYEGVLLAPAPGLATAERRVAYFSMEVALEGNIPTYSGGLGVLAGDTLRSCADLRVPVVGVSLLWRKGYFRQRIDAEGRQSEAPDAWEPTDFLERLTGTVEVEIEGRSVRVQPWRANVIGLGGYVVPLVLLDTDVDGNREDDRALTDRLYGGDERHRLCQETILGIGGVRALRALGYAGIRKFHMNEGHASLLVLELLREANGTAKADWDFEGVRSRCVFTTHTPVPAGHDRFDYALVERIVGPCVAPNVLQMLGGEERLNMTLLALNMSRFVNGVARRHGEVSREMFPGHPIHHITNGVHSWTWTCPSFRELYDRHVPGWSNDPAMLRQAIKIPAAEIWQAHLTAKLRLLAAVKERAGLGLDPEAFTIGFARRATQYKRLDLVFTDPEQLLRAAASHGPLQFVFAGKAHPRDTGGKDLIRRVVAAAQRLAPRVPVVYLENYDIELAKLLVSGVDLWLNTPQPPLEASGTSGMKAAHNGVPSLSTLDGWWPEGLVEGLTGWSIAARDAPSDLAALAAADAQALYERLERDIVPRFYGARDGWIDVMRHTVALNASHFNTHRMVQQYVTNAYLA
jgi:starch phosphorylase